MKIQNRTIFCRDNLEVLREIDDQSVSLVYADPPFHTQKDYKAADNSDASGAIFCDKWTLNNNDNMWLSNIADTDVGLYHIINASEYASGESMKAYLIFITIRLIAIKKILKDTGSIYLHCDQNASHYIKLIMDCVFGKNNFRNELIWNRTKAAKSSTNKFGASHDTILFYAKSDESVFNPLYKDYDDEYIKVNFKRSDKHGKWERIPITGPGTTKTDSSKEWRGINPTVRGRHWIVPGSIPSHVKLPNDWDTYTVRQKLDYYDDAGLIFHTKKEDGVPTFKKYLSVSKGYPMSDLILDISHINNVSSESVGYPTQKPLALLELIIKSSSNSNDIVLDPFCGSGTTFMAAERLGRRWIGIDSSEKATQIAQKRMQNELGFLGEVILK